MKRNRIFTLFAAILGILTAFAMLPAMASAQEFGNGQCVISARTLRELRYASFTTGSYHKIDNALTDGYVDIMLPIPNMGEHFVNFDLVDGTFDPGQPEALVYNYLGNGDLQLVAVEYIVPISESPTAPEGFSGDCDDWHVFGGTLWTLHAWIWYPNPDGIFAATNPRVP